MLHGFVALATQKSGSFFQVFFLASQLLLPSDVCAFEKFPYALPYGKERIMSRTIWSHASTLMYSKNTNSCH